MLPLELLLNCYVQCIVHYSVHCTVQEAEHCTAYNNVHSTVNPTLQICHSGWVMISGTLASLPP